MSQAPEVPSGKPQGAKPQVLHRGKLLGLRPRARHSRYVGSRRSTRQTCPSGTGGPTKSIIVALGVPARPGGGVTPQGVSRPAGSLDCRGRRPVGSIFPNPWRSTLRGPALSTSGRKQRRSRDALRGLDCSLLGLSHLYGRRFQTSALAIADLPEPLRIDRDCPSPVGSTCQN